MTGLLEVLAIVATSICALMVAFVLCLVATVIFDALALRRQLRETREMKSAHDKKAHPRKETS